MQENIYAVKAYTKSCLTFPPVMLKIGTRTIKNLDGGDPKLCQLINV